MAPVTTKVATVVPRILPARLREPMLATDPAMEANTSGTTTQNIMLMKILPRNAMLPAKAGATKPTTQPRIMAHSMMARKR